MSVTANLLPLFLEEADENIGALEAALLHLGTVPNDEPTLQTAFRAAHSIKGGAATFGFPEVVGLVHELEAVLDGARQCRLTLDLDRLELLLTAVDVVRSSISAAANGFPVDDRVWLQS